MTVDMSQFYQTFFEESFEGLDTMESSLLNLDVGAADEETINTIFRAAHSIKGGAGTFGFKAVSDFTHVMETLLDEIRDGKRLVTQETVDLLLQSVDCLRDMLTAVQNEDEIDQATVAAVQGNLEKLLNDASAGTPVEQRDDTGDEAATPEPAGEGWRIHFAPYEDLIKTGNDPVRMFRELAELGELEARLDDSQLPAFGEMDPEVCYLRWDLVLKTDAPLSVVEEVFEWVDGVCELRIEPLSSTGAEAATQEADAGSPAAPVPEAPVTNASAPAVPQRQAEPVVAENPTEAKAVTPKKKPASGGEHGSIRVSIDKVDALINLVGELVITQSMLGQIGDELDMDLDKLEKLRDGLGQLERNTRELQESVMRIRMLPISFAFQRFPRMVRDTAKKLNKEIELKLSGEQTELDKTVMEKIGDPLVHLVRNSIDHGVEPPEVREQAGKPRVGTVHLNAYHQGGNIVIEISDDGAGLNRDKILQKAREKGLVGEDEVPSDERIYDMIFDPGFSTADTISDVSGRGVGMDVVKRNIRELGGSIEVSTEAGKGSTFTIRLPLTLAILDGQLIRVGDDTFIVPLVSIIESLQADPAQINGLAGQAELYKLREDYIPIVRLYEVFGLKPKATRLEDGLLVVVEGDGQKVGLFVDDLLGQQQVVIKSLETNFRKVDGVSGATILGDGTVALILDISSLIQVSKRIGRKHRLPDEPTPEAGPDGDAATEQAA